MNHQHSSEARHPSSSSFDGLPVSGSWRHHLVIGLVAFLVVSGGSAFAQEDSSALEEEPPPVDGLNPVEVDAELDAFDFEALLAEGSRPMSADQAAALALETAPSVERARAAVSLAEAGSRATWVAFIPRLDVSARYVRIGGFDDGTISVMGDSQIPTDQALLLAEAVSDPAARTLLTGIVEQMSGIGNVEFSTPRNQTVFRASLMVPISDYFLTILPAYRATEAQTQMEERRLEAEQAEVALAAREAFYRYTQARAMHAVAQGAIALAEQHREQVEALVRAELGSRSDLLTAESRLAAARSAEARARGGVSLARAALLTLLHLDDDGSELAITEPMMTATALPPVVTEAVIDEAMSRRPEARALEELDAIHAHSARAARGGHIPRLALIAGAEVSNPNQRVIPPEEEFIPSWEVGASLSWSPSDSMRARARTAEADARRAQARAELDRLRDGVSLQLRQAREDAASAAVVMEAAQARVEAAEESYEARLAERRAGQAVSAQLLDAELEVSRARLDLINAAVDLRVANARFERAMGNRD